MSLLEPGPAHDAMHPQVADTKPTASVNLLADTIFANGLGADPRGLVTHDDQFDAIEDLLPLRQRMSHVMISAHASVDRILGEHLAQLTLAELQALKTQVTLREKQLMTTQDHTELFAEEHVEYYGKPTSVDPEPDAAQTAPAEQSEKLSLLEYAQIREENTNLAEVVCVRSTADLVKALRDPNAKYEIPGRRQGQTPLAAATSFVASALGLTFSAVDKRVTAAAALWPSMAYRRSKTKTPHFAAQLEQGRIPLATAIAAQEKLSSIRQAVRRAGGDEKAADELVEHKEREFLPHALRNNPHTFARFAKLRSEAVTNELIGPAKSLTNEQIKHEKGVFYDAPIGDNLHRLTVVVDDGELLHLTAIREFATKLDSVISTMRAEAHDDGDQGKGTPRLAAVSHENAHAGDDVPNNPRITPEDLDSGIGQLFDGQTKAERWLNTWLDFTSAGLMLHKTYDPRATAEEQQRRDDALQKAAEHSAVLSDILGLDSPTEKVVTSNDPLAPYVPDGYQLLRPNVDLIVEIPLRDLLGSSPASFQHPGTETDHSDTSELRKIIERLKHEEHGVTAPVGSPGNIKIDYGLARQQACNQRIIPMVLGTASQPLDVGRAQRSFSQAMRRALHVRDRGCVVPGCPRPSSWCEPHHLDEWAKGGVTAVSNAALLCRQHHGAVHKELLKIHMEADGRPSCSLPVAQDPTQTRYRNVFWIGS